MQQAALRSRWSWNSMPYLSGPGGPGAGEDEIQGGMNGAPARAPSRSAAGSQEPGADRDAMRWVLCGPAASRRSGRSGAAPLRRTRRSTRHRYAARSVLGR